MISSTNDEISQEQANARKEKHAKDIEQRDKAIDYLNKIMYGFQGFLRHN